MQLDDSNKSFFYDSLQTRRACNKIKAISRSNGSLATDIEEISQIADTHFNNLLNSPRDMYPTDPNNGGPSISRDQQAILLQGFTIEDIKKGLFEADCDRIQDRWF